MARKIRLPSGPKARMELTMPADLKEWLARTAFEAREDAGVLVRYGIELVRADIEERGVEAVLADIKQLEAAREKVS